MPDFTSHVVQQALDAIEEAEASGHLHPTDTDIVEASPDDVVEAVDAAAHHAGEALQPNPLSELAHAVGDFAHHAHDLMTDSIQDGHEVHDTASDAPDYATDDNAGGHDDSHADGQ